MPTIGGLMMNMAIQENILREAIYTNVKKELAEQGWSVASKLFSIGDNEIGSVAYSLGNTAKGLSEILIIPRYGTQVIVTEASKKAMAVIAKLLELPDFSYNDIPVLRINGNLIYEPHELSVEHQETIKEHLTYLNRIYGKHGYKVTVFRERLSNN
jgi:hypothetical protein